MTHWHMHVQGTSNGASYYTEEFDQIRAFLDQMDNPDDFQQITIQQPVMNREHSHVGYWINLDVEASDDESSNANDGGNSDE